jgi:hypothetical protein
MDYPLLFDRWKLRFKYRRGVESDEPSSGIPSESALFFEPGEPWTVQQEEDGSPTVIERSFGAGIVVLVAQSYAFSNEGLREARDAQWIARIVGPARTVAFDENHFGIDEAGSVATLMRKYRLEPAIGVLLVTALLFLWRNASSLLPPRRADSNQAVTGRDAQEGLVSLMERSLAEKDLLDTCYAEWSRTEARNQRAPLVEAAIVGHAGERPVEVYRAACNALSLPNKGRGRKG